ncbi:release factor glutamine methyltransferase [Nocardioides albertanoniae]|uniref:Release factor glutamine methyltransferase n=1 Tax=Nocardioides albertanoniae TaxID=1175486 RepID=A0A543A280_9ACTN|nr:putative protein N(5)-glutamine methyltransferase [Nocardioides albertanoniae]TQL66566.1 release factor glutamine methyltransferase [Nocardioides albertanoniae]
MTSPARDPAPGPGLVARLRAAGCVFAEEEAALLLGEAVSPQEREAMVVRRVAGEPLEAVLGWAELCGLRVRVAPGVFVPRQRSALMVELAVDHLGRPSRQARRPVVLDLGCGTGALGAVVAARVSGVEVWATDIDPAAVDCARTNLPARGQVLLGDLFDPLPRDLVFDVILANAPYVPTTRIADMPPEARDHEHRVALDGGEDGLDVQRRVIAQAPDHLVPGGILVVEAGEDQAPIAAGLMRDQGLAAEIRHDEETYATAVSGTKA